LSQAAGMESNTLCLSLLGIRNTGMTIRPNG
jgi:hypothetical protein